MKKNYLVLAVWFKSNSSTLNALLSCVENKSSLRIASDSSWLSPLFCADGPFVPHLWCRNPDVFTCNLVCLVIIPSPGPPGPPGVVIVEEITDHTATLSWTRGLDNHSPISTYNLQARSPFSLGWQTVKTGNQSRLDCRKWMWGLNFSLIYRWRINTVITVRMFEVIYLIRQFVLSKKSCLMSLVSGNPL